MTVRSLPSTLGDPVMMIYLSFLLQQELRTPVKDQGSTARMKAVRCNGKMVAVSVNLQLRCWSVLLSCARSVWDCLTEGERVSWDRGAIAGPLRDAAKGVFNGFVWYITCATVCQMLKTQEWKEQATVMDFPLLAESSDYKLHPGACQINSLRENMTYTRAKTLH